MTPAIYVSLFLCGLLGMVIMIINKLIALKKRSQVANLKFDAISYFKDDYLTILGTIAVLILWLIVVGNVLKLKPNLIDYLNFISALIGYAGLSLATLAFSKAEARVNEVIDKKTDIADGIIKK